MASAISRVCATIVEALPLGIVPACIATDGAISAVAVVVISLLILRSPLPDALPGITGVAP
jgi:hypothetical protein